MENDQVRYSVTTEDRHVFYVSISLTSKAQAKPSPEGRIAEYVKYHAFPEAGATVQIPDYHFDPHYF